LGKDGDSRWRKMTPPKNVRTRTQNIVTHLSGVTARSKGKSTPIDCWKYFFDEEIIDVIVENTHKFIKYIKLCSGKKC
jgi:hypothetical protein